MELGQKVISRDLSWIKDGTLGVVIARGPQSPDSGIEYAADISDVERAHADEFLGTADEFLVRLPGRNGGYYGYDGDGDFEPVE